MSAFYVNSYNLFLRLFVYNGISLHHSPIFHLPDNRPFKRVTTWPIISKTIVKKKHQIHDLFKYCNYD